MKVSRDMECSWKKPQIRRGGKTWLDYCRERFGHGELLTFLVLDGVLRKRSWTVGGANLAPRQYCEPLSREQSITAV